jgi:hypothetical protein
MKDYGKKVWLIPDGFIPSKSHENISHDAVCVLNTTDKDAHISLTLYFEDRDKMECFSAVCPAGRTNHIRMDKIRGNNGEMVYRDMPYAILVESDVNIVVQYSRLDTTQAENALMTTIAYPVE